MDTDREIIAIAVGREYLRTLLRALELYDGGQTYAHSWRVARGIRIIGTRIGWHPEVTGLGIRAALLHDIGKMLIPRPILIKPGEPDDVEWRELRRHPRLGFELVRGEDSGVAEVLVAHHECAWRPRGQEHRNYPRTDQRRHFSERRIIQRVLSQDRRFHERRADRSAWRPLHLALAVSDVIDALASERWYKQPFPDDRIRNIVREHFPLLPDIAEWLIAARAELQEPVTSLPIHLREPEPPEYL
ncbi:HD domain-containing protein [Candidatus Uhrbacteria bacterium]|nr:HD domain-containing protein [Candidatus Uhrbacteria bacterium]